MLNILLCDDEVPVLRQLEDYIGRVPRLMEENIRVASFTSAEELMASGRTETADILVLDICMGKLSGMEAAKEIRRRNPDIYLIFLTSMVHYALEGYEVHAWAFLPKPLKFERFASCMNEVLDQIDGRAESKIILKSGTDIDCLSSEDILYFDVLDHTTRVVMKDRERTYYTRLADVEQQLTGNEFFRCHKSYLVNMKHIRSILPDRLKMSNGDDVPLSKHRRREFLLAFSKYAERKS